MAIAAYLGGDDGRGLSPAIWGRFPGVLEHGWIDPQYGYFDFDDFTRFPLTATATAQAAIGQYKYFTSTGASLGDVGVNSVVGLGGQICAFSDGDNEGASLADAVAAHQITSLGKRFAFEARIKTSTISDTKHGFFIGLSDVLSTTLSATVPIAADGTIADRNVVGFHRLEGDGDKLDFIYKADGVTAVTVKADAHTLVADTWVKVGLLFEPDDGLLKAFFDGTQLSDTYAVPNATGTDFPADVALGRLFGVLNATATIPGYSTLDWWAIGQLV